MCGAVESISRAAEGAGASAQKHGKHSHVAVRYILDQPAVAGVIVGARLGVSEHLHNAKVFDFSLDESDESGLRLY